jgi:methionyl-tRNA formyltransferase
MDSARPKIIQLAYGEAALAGYLSLREYFEHLAIIVPPGKNSLTPVEEAANKDGVDIKRVSSIASVISLIEERVPDLVVVCSFDRVLPEKLLKVIPFFNVHYAPLPRYRGRATVNWAIINGEKTFAACIHRIVPDLDAGDVFFKGEIIIEERDRIRDVYDKLNDVIRKNLGCIVLEAYQGKISPVRLDDNIVPTYCCTRLPEDGCIDWHKSTAEVDRLIRAVGHPFPGAFTYLNGKKMFIWKARPVPNPQIYEGRVPGRIVNVIRGKGVEVLTGDGVLLIENVEIEDAGVHIASDLIKSVKITLGFSVVEVQEKLREIEKMLQNNKK